MTKIYEYDVKFLPRGQASEADTEETVKRALNERGSRGWMLVSLTTTGMAVFVREISGLLPGS